MFRGIGLGFGLMLRSDYKRTFGGASCLLLEGALPLPGRIVWQAAAGDQELAMSAMVPRNRVFERGRVDCLLCCLVFDPAILAVVCVPSMVYHDVCDACDRCF